jgi:polysaccharide biosynthesis protein PslH
MTRHDEALSRRLNILILSTQLPYPPDSGGLIRFYNLYSRLAQKHRLTWACPIWPGNEHHVRHAEEFCEQIVELPADDAITLPDHGWRNWWMRIVAHFHWERLFEFCFGDVKAPGLYWMPVTRERRQLIETIISSQSFDLVVCEFESAAELLPVGTHTPSIIGLHNMQSSVFKRARHTYPASLEDRLFFWPEYLKIIQRERRSYSRFSFAITVSESDQHLLRKRCSSLPTEVLPNGADVDYYQPASQLGQSKTLVYVGHYGYPPNADAILYFCREILPLVRQAAPGVQTLAVGHEPPHELEDFNGVRATGSVPDVRPYLAGASVVIVPLRVGGGTRLKILEALAMGKAIVSTSLGAEGLHVTHGQDIILADEPQDFAHWIIRLLQEPDLCAQLGDQGRKLVEREYSWDVLADQLNRIVWAVADSDGAIASRSNPSPVSLVSG